jgi:catechol 2,3-dioxygenase-like lactoylglutathione lyase family enzyme
MEVQPAHICILVKDVEAAKKFMADILDLKEPSEELDINAGEPWSIHSAFYNWGSFGIEFMGPTIDGSSTMLKEQLEKRGEGVHHICFYTETKGQAEIIKRLNNLGIGIKDIQGKPAETDAPNVYTSPKMTFGTPFQFETREYMESLKSKD